MARILVAFWTLECIAISWALLFHQSTTSGIVLTLHGTIETALIAWAGGPRIAQYIAPQIEKVGATIASAIRKTRDADQGIEPTEK